MEAAMAIGVQGSVTVNQVSDWGLSELFKFKAERKGLFTLNPGDIQSASEDFYDNITIAWNGIDGMRAVMEIVERLQAQHS
jgi:hypothetical protein